MSESLGRLKKRLRDTQRLLAKPDLAADKRNQAERKVEDLQRDIERQSHVEGEKKMTQRYKMVRFVEWKKVMRRIRQSKQRLQQQRDEVDGCEPGEASAELEELRLDLNYIVHFPPTTKYISCLASAQELGPKSLQARQEIRAAIAESMAKGDISQVPETERGTLNVEKKARSGQATVVKTKTSTSSKDDDLAQDDFFELD